MRDIKKVTVSVRWDDGSDAFWEIYPIDGHVSQSRVCEAYREIRANYKADYADLKAHWVAVCPDIPFPLDKH